ncbi:hypothetical protein D3C80_1814730 [compost metagenome]
MVLVVRKSCWLFHHEPPVPVAGSMGFSSSTTFCALRLMLWRTLATAFQLSLSCWSRRANTVVFSISFQLQGVVRLVLRDRPRSLPSEKRPRVLRTPLRSSRWWLAPKNSRVSSLASNSNDT